MPRQDPDPDIPATLVLEGAPALRLLAHEARQRVIAEVYDDGREITATEAAQLCGLTPSAMSYHLRMLEKAGLLLPGVAADGRERRYRRAARRFEVHGAGVDGAGARVPLRAAAGIWVGSLSRAVDAWLDAGSQGTGGLSTESLRLTDEQNTELVSRMRALFAEYDEISEGNGPEVAGFLSFWAHVPRVAGEQANPDDTARS